jgi:hypothetical protein
MNKLWMIRTLIMALLFCLLAWDAIRLLANHAFGNLPEQHREILLIGALLWFVTVLAANDRDDDWAGQF